MLANKCKSDSQIIWNDIQNIYLIAKNMNPDNHKSINDTKKHLYIKTIIGTIHNECTTVRSRMLARAVQNSLLIFTSSLLCKLLRMMVLLFSGNFHICSVDI